MKKQSPLRTLVFVFFVVFTFVAMWTNQDTTGTQHTTTALASPAHHATHATCITIEFDNRKHARILDHAWDAIRRAHPPLSISPPDHQREVKLLHIDRDGTDANRRASLKGIPTKQGYDRDEYPPAVSREGGAGADVRYVPSSENRSAGAVMGSQLSGYPDGQCFKYEPPPIK